MRAALRTRGWFYIVGALVFSNAQRVERIPEDIPPECDTVLFSMRGVPYIDVTCAQAMADVMEKLLQRGAKICVCGLSAETRTTFNRAGITDRLGEGAFAWSVDRALREAGLGEGAPCPSAE